MLRFQAELLYNKQVRRGKAEEGEKR